MKKIALLFLALCALIVSCDKTVKVPLSYTVENAQGNPFGEIFAPDSGTYDLAAWVKFLTGSSTDSVSLVLNGMPANVTVEHDTIKGLPTYIGHFILHLNNATQGTYPMSIVATAAGTEPKVYNFNMTIISANCATALRGTYTGTNTCTTRNYVYSSVASYGGPVNTLNITNFGGYGPTTVTNVVINCTNDSLSIPSQNIGNGVVLSGYGVSAANRMTFYYTASNASGVTSETCSAILTK